MPIDSGKKVIILYILQVLRKYTDENHTMTQQDIRDKLRSDYDMDVSRATIKRNIADLIDADYEIKYREVRRTYVDRNTGETEENIIYTDLYYVHDFLESELRLLIDGLLFSRSVPYTARKDLIDKLADLSGSHFSKRMKRVHNMSADGPQNRDLFWNIEVLDQAIEEGKQVEITYGYFGTDMKLHENLNADGSVKRQVLNPYQLAACEGRYYLICNNDKYNTVANYRVDRIISVDMLDTPVKRKSEVAGLEDGLDLQKYVYQNLNMFSGEPEKAEFEIPSGAVSLVIDFFGKHVRFFDRGDGTVSCSLMVSREAMKRWAAQFAGVVRVTSPAELVEDVKAEIRKSAENYGMKVEKGSGLPCQ